MNLEARIKKLEDIDYPELAKIEQLTSILIGENFANEDKLAKSKQNSKVDSPDNLFNRFQKLEKTIDEFPRLVNRINRQENIHCEIADTVTRFRNVVTLHHETMEELT